MRKALSFALVSCVVFSAAASLAGDVPTIKFIPDVILGDGNAPAQTAGNYYVYDGLDLDSFVLDEDVAVPVQAAFSVADQGRNLSIDGKARVSATALVTAQTSGIIAANKNVLGAGNEVIRAVSDAFTAQGPDVPLGAAATPNWGFANGATETYVTVVAGEGSGSASSGFWVSLVDNADSGTTGGAAVNEVDYSNFVPIPGFVGDGWVYFNAGATNGLAIATSGSVGTVPFDALRLTTVAGNTTIGFGSWNKFDVNFAPEWIPNTLVRASYTISNNQTNANAVPGFRSIMRYGGATTSDTTFRLAHSELMCDNQVKNYNSKLLANNNQFVLKHYYNNQYAADNNLPGNVGLAFDMCDWTRQASTGLPDAFGTHTLDRVVVEVIPTPADSDVANFYNASGATLGQGWLSFLVGFDPALPGSGSFTYTYTNGVNVRSSSATYTEQRLFALLYKGDFGTGAKLSNTAGSLVRCRINLESAIADTNPNPDITSQAQCDIRLRLTTDYQEMFHVLWLHSWYANNTPALGKPGLDIPVAGSPKVYDLYMETPVDSPTNDAKWVFAFDVINYYHPSTAQAPGTKYPKSAANFTITNIQMGEVIR